MCSCRGSDGSTGDIIPPNICSTTTKATTAFWERISTWYSAVVESSDEVNFLCEPCTCPQAGKKALSEAGHSCFPLLTCFSAVGTDCYEWKTLSTENALLVPIRQFYMRGEWHITGIKKSIICNIFHVYLPLSIVEHLNKTGKKWNVITQVNGIENESVLCLFAAAL